MRKICIATWLYSNQPINVMISAVMLLAVIHMMPAHADAYLDALQDEAADLSVDPETAATKPGAEEVVGDKNLKQAAFESMLDKHYHGTYIFYTRLSEESRALVYQAYTKSPDVKPLRQMIMDLLVNK